jgi:hypothetical protein
MLRGRNHWGAHSCTGALPLPTCFQPFGLGSRGVSVSPSGWGAAARPSARRAERQRVPQPGGLGVSSRWPAQRRHRVRWRRYCSTTPQGSNDVGAHRPTSSRRRAHGPHRWAGRLCDPFGVVTNRGSHPCTGALPLPIDFQPFGLGVSMSFSPEGWCVGEVVLHTGALPLPTCFQPFGLGESRRVRQPFGLGSRSVSFSPEGWASAFPSARRAERQRVLQPSACPSARRAGRQ